jgi:Tfp pilus assembly protein PilF
MMDIADKDLASAQRLLETALTIDPRLAPAQGNLAVIYVLKGDNVKAESLLREALENDPNYMEGYLNLGLILASERRFTEAEPDLEHALKLAPDDARVLTALGNVKSQLGNAQKQ